MSEVSQVFEYPQSRQVDQVDDYHGTPVSDPYRWLEDLESDQTQAWVEDQNQITFEFLEQIPTRESLKSRLEELWNYEKYGIPSKQGDRLFYFKNSGLQNQSVLYCLQEPDVEPQILLDPNTLSDDGTTALSRISISENGQYLAYGLSQSGSDWQEWKVRNIDSKEDLGDHLKWIKFSTVTWSKDTQGFYYNRYAEPKEGQEYQEQNYYEKLYYHRLGDPQSADRLIYERPDQKEWGFSPTITEDGKYLLISVWRSTELKNLVFYQDLSQDNSPIIELISEFEDSYQFIGNQGSIFWFITNWQAPKWRVIAIDINHPEQENWQEIIPESNDVIGKVSLLNHQFVVQSMQDAHSQVKIYSLEGEYLKTLALPGLGSVNGFNGKPEDTETFYSFTSYTTTTTIYRYDLLTGESTLYRQPEVNFNPDDYESKQVFYPSKDGTQVPLFITHKKGITLDGSNPTLLYGYGGFSISLTPGFSVSHLVWMEQGGIYAVPNLRGGGEYGEDWHQAGMKQNKQNVFDDFIAAAEWLIEQQYTCSEKLAIAGGSNGGLLVGASLTQRPDLFGAALPAVGVMDMLRFHKFTIGWAWCDEYGCADHPEDFENLYRYSPLHNLKPGTAYPATLVTTSDRDDRVVPSHSFKFAAALQAAHRASSPVLIRIETKAGHGAGKPTSKQIQEIADKWAFLTQVLGIA
ncbi:prolyl oligopeptidase family serine peptidase [Roseofilum reptotaenium CS-1145]|uniref:prolyl oligopeptidase n=1 Tax=Roseofilum reptotaenium AO1-A TaxID=1925591 RepID=A0A1L9QMR6_9CYAN|nr:prolyl oligopeptidase family serine peptidase [Roseofilum reptotaenium]MDB9515677.1 prolyl oligopeptidase family serine peptidase [Roseofilum reptotaenium CS-1145]OJJ22727.1 S9 family peptidase [Roseofilum reptotaenium AO1-A]